MKVKSIQKMEFQLPVLNPFVVTFHHRDLFPIGNDNMEPIFDPSTKAIGNDFDHNAQWRMYYGSKVPGFPVHPHRGFETITVVMEGFADHFDSLGSKGRYGEGDVQWMTAGAGIQHSEMFPVLNNEKENPMELFQIWLNLPKKNKFAKPDYKMLWNEDIPVAKESDKSVKVIAGTYKGVKSLAPLPASWAYDRSNNIGIWLIELDGEGEIILPAVSPTLNRMIYYYRGEDQLMIEDRMLDSNFCAQLDGNQEIHIKAGKSIARLLLLEGEPINEPVAAHGPFVMNTREELIAAFDEYQETQFGGWPWDEGGPVNSKNAGRFADYRHGERIEKPKTK